jgi:hypothetical protein
MNEDLTIIYLTLNLLPKKWQEYQIDVLKKCIGNAPIISISRLPMDLGTNLIQSEEPSPSNVYRQVLRGAKLAKTKYIAIAEDDTLYVSDHFRHRPADDEFAYNLSHWSLFTWGTPIYGWRNRKGNYSMIANRELVIEALEERFEKHPNGTPPELTGELGRWKVDRYLGVKQRKEVDFYTNNPIINVNHELGLDDRARRHQKTLGTLRAYDIPMWGKASDLVKKFV